MGEDFYRKAVLGMLFFLSLFFFVGVLDNIAKDYGMTGFVIHSKYSSFSAPEQGFIFNNISNSVVVSDDAVYRTGYYSINGSAWKSFNLNGNYYGENSEWIRTTASSSLPYFGAGEHYVIIYSCKYSGDIWDCHGYGWQLIVINNSIPSNDTVHCTDTCGSLGYQCGTRTICGLSVDCGNCSQGYNCTNNMCVYSQSPQNVTCNGVSCNSGEYCFQGVCLLNVSGKTYFVALNGSDSNPGTFEAPFYSWQKGVQVARPGDIVYIRGGIWIPTSHILTSGGYDTGAIAMTIGVSGTANAPIRYYNYPGETPIMDGRLLLPNQDGWQGGIGISDVEYIYFRGLTVRNIFQRLPDFTKEKPHSEVYGVSSSNSANLRFENMVVYNINGRGFQHWGGAWAESDVTSDDDFPLFDSDNTSWINCDAYNLFDRYSLTPGNAADGWKVVGYPANYYYWEGCRAWNYSDDGFDPNGAHRFFKNCWAMSTNYYQELFDEGSSGSWDPEGNGFKISGINPNYPGYSEGGEVFVRMENSLAAICAGTGMANNIEVNYQNQWPNNGVFYNSIAYKTSGGFFDLGSNLEKTSRSTEYRNNIAFGGTDKSGEGYGLPDPLYEVGIYNPNVYPHSHNSWRAKEGESWPGWEYNPDYTVTDDDFVSLDATQLTLPRKADYSLPDITFLHLKKGSDLIDGGVVVPGYHCDTVGDHPGEDCRVWYGSAPDLGPFESNY